MTPTGTYSITVEGTGGGLNHSTAVTLVVNAPVVANFSLSCAPASLSVQQNGSGRSVCTVTSSGGFNSAVSLSCQALNGVACSYSPPSVTPPANGSVRSTLTIDVAGSVAQGSYTLTVKGVSGSLAQTTPVTLTVTRRFGR